MPKVDDEKMVSPCCGYDYCVCGNTLGAIGPRVRWGDLSIKVKTDHLSMVIATMEKGKASTKRIAEVQSILDKLL
jgi:hypothetical protein